MVPTVIRLDQGEQGHQRPKEGRIRDDQADHDNGQAGQPVAQIEQQRVERPKRGRLLSLVPLPGNAVVPATVPERKRGDKVAPEAAELRPLVVPAPATAPP